MKDQPKPTTDNDTSKKGVANTPNTAIPTSQITETQRAALKSKYSQLTDADLSGTPDEVATKVSAKIGMTKQDIVNILQDRQNL